MERISIHVPELLPNGSSIAADVFASYEEELYGVAFKASLASGGGNEQGFTVLTGVCGAWRSPGGKVYRDPVRIYCLDVAGVEVVMKDVEQLTQRMRPELEQEAVYVTITAIAVFTAFDRPLIATPRKLRRHLNIDVARVPIAVVKFRASY